MKIWRDHSNSCIRMRFLESGTVLRGRFPMKFCKLCKAANLIFACAASSTLTAQTQPAPAADTLLRAFADPPNSAKPRVWWRWMNGNITQEGINLDLDWMHRVGVGGRSEEHTSELQSLRHLV